MIQIDDAGSGSLIGGTGIGVLNTDTNEYHFDIIPLKYYQTSQLFKEKKYQDYVITIIRESFKKLKVTKSHEIEICQGYMFDKLREWLTENGYKWSSTKITGPLQNRIEECFNQYAIGLGLPKNFVKHAQFAFGFHRLLKWVLADVENRKKLCKTQWKSWQKWGNVEQSIYPNQLSYSDYCLKCGKKIEPPVDVITIEYITYKPATINIHKTCFTGYLNVFPPTFLTSFNTIIKTPNNHLSELYLEPSEKLTLKDMENQLNLITKTGHLVGTLPKNLADKVIFWLSKGFIWDFYLKDFSNNNAIIFAKLN